MGKTEQPGIVAHPGGRVSGAPSLDFATAKTSFKFPSDNDIVTMTQRPQWLQLAELFDYVEHVRVWVKDRDGRFSWVNRAALLMHATDGHEGHCVQGMLGKTDYDQSPAFLADQYRLDDEFVLAGNRIVNRIELIRQPDGTTAWHVTNKIPLFDGDGAVIGTAGIARPLNTSSHQIVSGTEFGPVLAHMRDHYHSAITNQQLARLAHMSVRAFERKFHSSFHLTPQKYLRNLRLRMAAHTLVYTDRLLAQVALSCGFADQSHFSREFRRYFGRTPREYREHFALGTAAAASGTILAAVEQ
ncbi:MAG: AraC family transcriptional regulator [Thermoguttaceae bacterium]